MFAALIYKDLDTRTGFRCVHWTTICIPWPAPQDLANGPLSSPYLAFTVQREYTLISL
jgi:hypothetical protein